MVDGASQIGAVVAEKYMKTSTDVEKKEVCQLARLFTTRRGTI